VEGISGWHYSGDPWGPLYFCGCCHDNEGSELMPLHEWRSVDELKFLGITLLILLALCAIIGT